MSEQPHSPEERHFEGFGFGHIEAVQVGPEHTTLEVHDHVAGTLDGKPVVGTSNTYEVRLPHRTTPDESPRKGKVYGFSKWGANWQPTGPQGNPNLN
jgi:hypothetical protein